MNNLSTKLSMLSSFRSFLFPKKSSLIVSCSRKQKQLLSLFLILIVPFVFLSAQVTPPNADSDADCGADCYDLFSFSPQLDGNGVPIPNIGDGLAQDNNCNTIIDAEVEYEGNDTNIDVSGTAVAANMQGTTAWTDTWTYTFGTSLTNPVFQLSSLFSDSEVSFTDCNGSPLPLVDISTGTSIPSGTFFGNDEVQVIGNVTCIIITLSLIHI